MASESSSPVEVDSSGGVVGEIDNPTEDLEHANDNGPSQEENEEEAQGEDDNGENENKPGEATSNSGEPMRSSNMLDLDDMKDAVWFLYPDKKDRISRFFLLITCAAIIATMGLANNSAATVIGAMIVAPLMTPILGTMLGIVLVDEPNFFVSLGLVCAGGGTAILIGYVFGLGLNPHTIIAENNDQVAARTEPNLNDLIAALATGAVGSIALVRKDIAGTLPGVAIAISLVPPLCVVGMTLSTGSFHDSLGAFLLFATNFAAIVMTGIIVMYIYGVHRMGADNALSRLKRLFAVLMIALLVVLVAVPLTYSSAQISHLANVEACLKTKINTWAEPFGWETTIITAQTGEGGYTATVYITGSPPFPTENLPPLKSCDVDEITLRFIPQKKIEL